MNESDNHASCWKCRHCLFDIAVNKYICGKTGSAIGGHYDVWKPTECKEWER